MTHQYHVLGETYEFESNSGLVSDLAEEAAKDFHSCHDGWECSWPLEFTILRDKKVVGVFSVDRVTIPEFYASKI